jgi:hypothetical protein
LHFRVESKAQYLELEHEDYQRSNAGYKHPNLCGHLSVETILETEYGDDISIDWIWEQVPTARSELTGYDDWTQFFNNNDTYPGWSARTEFVDWRWRKGNTQEEISSYLEDGSYLIVGVTLDKYSGGLVPGTYEGDKDKRYVGHWVVVASVDENMITIYNPYTDTYQGLSWQAWTATDGVTIVITPP